VKIISLPIAIIIVCSLVLVVFFLALHDYNIFFEDTKSTINDERYSIYKNKFGGNTMYIVKIKNEPYIIVYKNIDIVIPNGASIKKMFNICFLRKGTLGVSISSPKMDLPGFIRWGEDGVMFSFHEKKYFLIF
jgi:hypothetical protein